MASRVLAAGLALLCFGVLSTHVHLGFERVRVRAITTPLAAAGSMVRVDLPDLRQLRGGPAALVARLAAGDAAAHLRVRFDDTSVQEVTVEPGRVQRIDARTPTITRALDHTVTIEGDRPGWSLQYLEIANVHGYTDGIVSLVIVPRGYRAGSRVPWWMALLICLELYVLGTGVARPRRHWIRMAHGAASALVVLLFALVLIGGAVTPFTVLFSPATVLLGLAVIYATPLTVGLRQAAAALPSARVMAAYAPHAAITVMMLVGVAHYYDPDAGFTRLMNFGRAFERRALPQVRELPVRFDTDYGYDGQFYAQQALDPLLRDRATVRALDAPGYRARRVLGPAVAYLAGLGQPWPVLQIYALLNVFCWLMLGWLLLRWLPAGGAASTLAWSGAMLSHGLVMSLRLALADGPAALVITFGIVALQANRRWLSAGLLGLSGLAKETSLIAGSILLPTRAARNPGFSRLATQAALVVMPLVVWTSYLGLRDLPGEAAGSGNFALPLTAYVEAWARSLRGVATAQRAPGAWNGLAALVALTTQAGVLLWRRDWRNPWWRVGIGYAALMCVAGPAVWEGQPGAITRVVLPMTLAFNVGLPGTPGFLLWWILGNANIGASLADFSAGWP